MTYWRETMRRMLRRARCHAGLSQENLARELGIRFATVIQPPIPHLEPHASALPPVERKKRIRKNPVTANAANTVKAT